MYTTIRRDSLKRIRPLLENAALITRYTDDGQDCNQGRTTAAEVMALAPRFRSVSLDDRGVLHVTIHSCHFYSAYPTREAAEKALVSGAVAKYFGEAVLAAGPL